MEQMEALERVDTGRLLAEAEQLLAAGDVDGFEHFVHTLETKRQQYLEIEKQAAVAARQVEQEFINLRGELAYNPAAVEQYREAQLVLDFHLSRLQAGRKEAETLAGVLVRLRPQLERFVGRHKAIELAVRARELKDELRRLKEALLPPLEQIVEKIFALQRDAVTFNRTVSLAHLPQTQFLQCRVDLTQLLAAFAELDVVVTPEMEQLTATTSRSQAPSEPGVYKAMVPEFWPREETSERVVR